MGDGGGAAGSVAGRGTAGRRWRIDALLSRGRAGADLLLGTPPGVLREAQGTAAATLEAYVENYLEEEIRREALARDLGAFAVFARLAAIESGRRLNVAKLSRDSGIPASTIKNYYEILVDTFLGCFIRPYSRRARTRLSMAPRFLLLDTGVRNAAAGLPLQSGILATEGPSLLEQWVGMELFRRATYLGRAFRVASWRAVSGVEVDYVWEGPDEDVPIEVKWTERPQPADARHVETFLSTYPSRARRGFVVCRCERAQQLTERVTAIPWSEL